MNLAERVWASSGFIIMLCGGVLCEMNMSTIGATCYVVGAITAFTSIRE